MADTVVPVALWLFRLSTVARLLAAAFLVADGSAGLGAIVCVANLIILRTQFRYFSLPRSFSAAALCLWLGHVPFLVFADLPAFASRLLVGSIAFDFGLTVVLCCLGWVRVKRMLANPEAAAIERERLREEAAALGVEIPPWREEW